MGPAPRCPSKALRYLSPIVVGVLVGQYLLGLWTNLYAPPSGFSSNSSTPSLDWHYNLGYTLGLWAILCVILAGIARQLPLLGLAVLLLAGVFVAGFSGGNFVLTSPNSAIWSFVMGGMFLVAFIAAGALSYWTWARGPSPSPAAAAPSGA